MDADTREPGDVEDTESDTLEAEAVISDDLVASGGDGCGVLDFPLGHGYPRDFPDLIFEDVTLPGAIDG